MRNRDRFTKKQMLYVIHEQKGLLVPAAKRLKCNRQTIMNYAKKYPEIQDAIDEEREAFLDVAESALMRKVEVEGDIRAITFVLRTLGRHRGYAERIETSGPNGGPQEHAVKYDFSDLSTDDIRSVLARIRTSGEA